jgi:DNA-binding XRE family transcriptional regulator
MPDLRAIRKRLNMTQAELAAALGVSRWTIVQRETGKVPVTRETELALQALMLLRQPASSRANRQYASSRPDTPPGP